MMPRFLFLFLLAMPVWSQEVGVILFEHSEFQGRYEVFATDDPDLSDNTIGYHQASSVRVPPGWTVTLFSDRSFQGESLDLTHDEARLSKTDFGNDRVGSLQVIRATQAGIPAAHGIQLFDQAGFRGRHETLTADRANLKDSIVGNDRLRSLRVPRGVKVTCFGDRDFEGEAEVFLSDDSDLSENSIGADSVSSIKVDPLDPEVLDLTSEGVVLFEHESFEGKREPFFADDPDLEDNLMGLNQASSIKVPDGLVLELFGRPNFKGKSLSLRGDLWDLGQTKLGNDNSGSLKIRIDPSEARGSSETRPHDVGSRTTLDAIEQTPHEPEDPKPPTTSHQASRENSTKEPSTKEQADMAIILFSEIYFGGNREELTVSDGDLSDNAISAEGVGSIQVFAGYRVTLYDQPHFQGRSETLTFDDTDMRDNLVNGRTLASIKIEKVAF